MVYIFYVKKSKKRINLGKEFQDIAENPYFYVK